VKIQDGRLARLCLGVPRNERFSIAAGKLDFLNANESRFGGRYTRRVREIHEQPVAEKSTDADDHIGGDEPEDGVHVSFSETRSQGNAPGALPRQLKAP
jgi:hypothetical protein